MELEVQQQPQFPKTVQVVHERQPTDLGSIYDEINKNVNESYSQKRSEKKYTDDEVLDIILKIQQQQTDNSKTLNEVLTKHRDDIKNAFNQQISTQITKPYNDLQTKNSEIQKTINTLSETQISLTKITDQDRKWFGVVGICTALGLSINFIMFAYLWYHTHK